MHRLNKDKTKNRKRKIQMNKRSGLFVGERALFASRDLTVSDSVFRDGESPLKESKNIEVINSSFEFQYP